MRLLVQSIVVVAASFTGRPGQVSRRVSAMNRHPGSTNRMSLFFSSPYLVFPGFVFRSYSALPRLSTRLPSSLSLHCPFPPSSLEHQSTSMTRPSKSSPTPRLRLWRGESLTDSQTAPLEGGKSHRLPGFSLEFSFFPLARIEFTRR